MEEIAPFPDDVDDDIMLKMSSATFTWEAEEEEKIGMCSVKVGIVMLSVMCLLVIYSIIVSFELCVRLMWELFTCTVCVCVLFLLCVCALRVCVCVCARVCGVCVFVCVVCGCCVCVRGGAMVTASVCYVCMLLHWMLLFCLIASMFLL